MCSLIPLSLFLTLASAPAAETTVRPWEVFELEMTAAAETTVLPDEPAARVVFETPGITLKVSAFWDGGRTWRVRFAPPSAGEWRYHAESADAGLNNLRGSFRCTAWSEEEKRANPARRGFVRSAPGAHYFEYSDGTPFLWIGDTWWNWSKKGIQLRDLPASWRTTARRRDSRSGRLYFAGNGGLLDRPVRAAEPGADPQGRGR